ncbi:MAG: hypothetical protein ABF293_13485 [Flavobacteriaceae bacterium]
MPTLRNQIKIAIGYFLLAAILGMVLRAFYTGEITINYKFILHTHSHIALLGWVYLALTTLIYKLFLGPLKLSINYSRIFWFTQASLLGMLLTFPFQGYALFSIIFSTLFLFASYWFTAFFLKNTPAELRKTNSFRCIRAALWYLVFSSIGPWALGAIMNILGPESAWYRLAIYFYLHFLYNGWMIMALVGLFLYVLEQRQIKISDRIFGQFYWSINLGISLSFFLSALFAKPPLFLYLIGGTGAVLQLLAFGILLKGLTKSPKSWDRIFGPFQKLLFKTVLVLLMIKLLLQLTTAFPYFADLAATYLDFTIGYLHWTFLGVITIGLFLMLDVFGLIKFSRAMMRIYILGFVSSELLIFYRGISAWLNLTAFQGHAPALLLSSLLMVIALFLLLFKNIRSSVVH